MLPASVAALLVLAPGAEAAVDNAFDGERDTIRCGPGEDLAMVDRRDRVHGCEKVAERDA